ncbi:UNVERIFIED_CONTAM: CCAAT/enhancer-binding protein zeta [Sesamum calycinum]|uniref:CCAAT/enhancer-binding protein zeta n=1 Tax=Sesamum calycinum TaxID=2727403 RepID=A0AAW2NFV8_9LAMI
MVAVRKPKPSEDTATLQSDLASFASSLGFSSAAAPSSGFNDSDFRKTGPIKPQQDQKPAKNQKYEPRNSNLLAETDNNRFKNLPKLPLVKASALGVWHDDAAELEEKLIGKDKKIEFNSVEEWRSLVEKKKELGERLLVQYAQDYLSSRGQHGDIKMLVATQRSGTAADKVSALSVLIGDNAVANLRSIDSLLGMVTSKVGKRHAFTAFEALKEIFIILLPDRKLKTLFQRPLNHLPDTKDGYSLLLFWHWEECLKERYVKFISALEEASLDVIVKLKSIALKTIYTLLKSKSEQERRLLSSLVNKLGDPENKVASNADYHLANLLAEHPNMKAVVIDEVDTFLFRPRLGLRAKYHAEEMFIALILRAMKNDINIKRVAAFSKRLLQSLKHDLLFGMYCFKMRLLMLMTILSIFEDITEDDDNQVIPVSNRDNKERVADISKESDDDSESSPDESGSASSGSDGDTLNDTDDLLGEGGLIKHKEFKPTSDHEVQNHEGPMLPGGYNPRHREPTYCNADKVGWWELMVLASHVHPSVAAMARTLLSGVNIVYNGNPLSDFSLGAFLDKFMEKKPKQSIWHGASQIEPAKKVQLFQSNCNFAVLPEQNEFLEETKKEKKKTADDEAAEELYAVDGDEDGSDDEEIDNMLDSVNPTSEEGDYDYDDLDKIADDEDLIADGSDEELDIPSDIDNEDIENGETSSRENSDNSDGDIAIGEADDGSDDVAIGEADDGSDFDDGFDQREKKRRSRKDSKSSPFASLEDYQHLMEDDAAESNSSEKKKRNKSKKKRKVS